MLVWCLKNETARENHNSKIGKNNKDVLVKLFGTASLVFGLIPMNHGDLDPAFLYLEQRVEVNSYSLI